MKQRNPLVGQFTYQYSLTGQYSTISFPNGQSRNYSYDDQGRLLQLANTLGATDLGTFAYGYDNPLLGQRTSMTSGLGMTNYSYDSNYQLTGATYPNTAPFNGEVHSWTYDNIGNRLTNTVNASTANYTYFKNGSNPLNGQRLQSDGTKTYTYDANGNVTGDGTYTYTWDYENRLTGITGGGLTASYSYDYLGRRKSKTVNGVTTNYLYERRNLIRESDQGISIDHIFGREIDEPLAQNLASAASYFVIDGHGSIVMLNDPIGNVENNYNYDGWGVVRLQSGVVPNSFAFTSREISESGLYYYRERYYKPNIGRFMSPDPLGFNDGPSLYSYTQNQPILHTDPTGLSIYVCSRPVEWPGGLDKVANHAYLWDPTSNRFCARNGAFGSGNPNRSENPKAKQCREVPGSEGKEDQIMKCCQKNANAWGYTLGPRGFILPPPFTGDCHALAEWCVEKSGATWPGAPGGRIAPPCDTCPTSPPPIKQDPCKNDHRFC
jgi:RHS repeat-associated protein